LKTQIITLESHDDLISVRDRMSWAKTPRILLVWPKYEKVLLRLLDLKVLQRHADSLGAQLGLVTRRANVRRDAESLGIPVFDSTAAAQKEAWPVSAPRTRRAPRVPRRDLRSMREAVTEKEAAWRTSLAGRVITFTAGVLAVLAVAGLFVPRAAVTLYPEEQVQALVIPVSASASVSSVSLTGSLPAYEITAAADGEQSLAIGSQISVPKAKAQGVVRFINLSQAEVNIPQRTVVISSGGDAVRFVTLHETNLPAGLNQFVDVPIEAVAAGLQGNADAGVITIVEGGLGLSVTVTNPEPIEGGTEIKTTGPTSADRARLRNVMMQNLQRDAEEQMRVSLAGDDIILPDTLLVSEVKNEAYDPGEGQPGKSLKLAMEVEFAARYVSGGDLGRLTLSSLDSLLPVDFDAAELPALEPVAKPVTDSEGVTHFELSVTRRLLHKINFADVFTLTRGRSLETAGSKLAEGLPLREPPRIELTPSWWPMMPLIPFSLSVEMK